MWNIEFIENELFTRHGYLSKNINLPHFLHNNPSYMEDINKLCKDNLYGLKVERVHEYVHDKLLPKMIQQDMQNDDIDALDLINLDVDEDDDFIGVTEELSEQKKSYLHQYGLKNLFQSTVFTWMISLGMKYCERRKNYFVCNNKKGVNMIYQWSCVK